MNDVHVQLERLLEVRRLDQAERLVAKAFAESPGDGENHYYAARVALERSRLNEAREELGRLFATDPEHFRGRLLLVDVAQKESRHAEAEEELLALMRERPADADLFAKYASIMLETLHVRKARRLVDEALRLDPANQYARVIDVLVSVVQGNAGAARGGLEELVRASPDARHVALTMVTVLSNEHRYAEALVLAQELFRGAPHDAELLELLIELRTRTHWTALPAWPMARFGVAFTIGSWLAVGVAVRLLFRFGQHDVAAVVGICWLLYCLYSWTYHGLLVRWLRRRGL